MYKKIVRIVRGAMVIYIIYMVFPNEVKMIGESIIMIVKGAFVWMWDITSEGIKSNINGWLDGCKDSILEWVKSQLTFGGK